MPKPPCYDELPSPRRETLKAIYRLTRDGAEAHTGALAETARRVARARSRTRSSGWPSGGSSTTARTRASSSPPTGRRAAVAAIRRHRIVERFLADMLGYAWNEADRAGRRFEHELPQEVEDRLFVALDRPATCPHGFPIPAPEAVDIPGMPAALRPRARRRRRGRRAGLDRRRACRFLDTLGLRPGRAGRGPEKHPFDGPLVVGSTARTAPSGEQVARQVS